MVFEVLDVAIFLSTLPGAGDRLVIYSVKSEVDSHKISFAVISILGRKPHFQVKQLKKIIESRIKAKKIFGEINYKKNIGQVSCLAPIYSK